MKKCIGWCELNVIMYHIKNRENRKIKCVYRQLLRQDDQK